MELKWHNGIRWQRSARALTPLIVGLCILVTTGCGNYRKLNEENPHFQKAEAARARGDYTSAEHYFLECLKFSPESMKAHLQLGILYEEQMKDYPRAIVHFKAYFESLDGQNEDVQRMLGRVEKLYLQELLQKHAGQPSPAPETRLEPVVIPPVAPPPNSIDNGQKPEAGPGRPRTYVVQEGDILSKISIKVYGTSKHWDLIFKANAATLSSPEKIKVGQTLIIPDLPE